MSGTGTFLKYKIIYPIFKVAYTCGMNGISVRSKEALEMTCAFIQHCRISMIVFKH
jgi:hypothetical protein